MSAAAVCVPRGTRPAFELLDKCLDAGGRLCHELAHLTLADPLLEPPRERLPLLMAAHAPIVSRRAIGSRRLGREAGSGDGQRPTRGFCSKSADGWSRSACSVSTWATEGKSVRGARDCEVFDEREPGRGWAAGALTF